MSGCLAARTRLLPRRRHSTDDCERNYVISQKKQDEEVTTNGAIMANLWSKSCNLLFKKRRFIEFYGIIMLQTLLQWSEQAASEDPSGFADLCTQYESFATVSNIKVSSSCDQTAWFKRTRCTPDFWWIRRKTYPPLKATLP